MGAGRAAVRGTIGAARAVRAGPEGEGRPRGPGSAWRGLASEVTRRRAAVGGGVGARAGGETPGAARTQPVELRGAGAELRARAHVGAGAGHRAGR